MPLGQVDDCEHRSQPGPTAHRARAGDGSARRRVRVLALNGLVVVRDGLGRILTAAAITCAALLVLSPANNSDGPRRAALSSQSINSCGACSDASKATNRFPAASSGAARHAACAPLAGGTDFTAFGGWQAIHRY